MINFITIRNDNQQFSQPLKTHFLTHQLSTASHFDKMNGIVLRFKLISNDQYICYRIQDFVSVCIIKESMIVLLSFLVGQFFMSSILCQCPSACPCQSKTMICEICLAAYYQTYNVSVGDCQCINGFQKFAGGGDFCCPNNCRKCYHRGCASCRHNAEVLWNSTHKYNECKCGTNYYRIGKNCLCLANRWPDQFYANPETEGCHVCPPGCICTEDGCIQCRGDTNRLIKKTLYNLSTCFCEHPYVDEQGTCVCPRNCTCENGSILTCSPLSNRFKDYKSWPCRQPYRQIDGSCHCLQPYALIDVFGEERCLCKSKTNYTGYHEVYGVCKPCGKGCTCSKQGCMSCVSPFRTISSFQCICHPTAVEINGQCACVSPFYDDGSGVCRCLIDLYPGLYYYNRYPSVEGECLACPAGCKCSEIGCYKCQKHTLREVEQRSIWINHAHVVSFYCRCQDSAVSKEDGTCRCRRQYFYDEELQQCVCLSQLYPTLSYKHNENCLLCPELCLCDETGCYQCHESALRHVTLVTVQEDNVNFDLVEIFVCPCIPALFNNRSSETCKCSERKKYDKRANRCLCLEPLYEITSYYTITYCICKSSQYPEQYYFGYEGDPICYKCPIGCKCSKLGCYDCEKYAMRYIDIVYLKEIREQFENRTVMYRCPCYQDAFDLDGNCTICPNNSYYNGQGCTLCRDCRTCNPKGCLTCNEGMDLVNGTCVCRNGNLRNVEGFCNCRAGFYVKQVDPSVDTDLECAKCPNRCLTCHKVNDTVKCLSCSTMNTNRQDISEDNCPCRHNYVEHRDFKEYCCSVYCDDCDAEGCVSCPLFTFRTLTNGSCQCLPPFQQVPIYIEGVSQQNQHSENNHLTSLNRVQLQVTCGCQKGTYYSSQSCPLCPSGCTSCFYDSGAQAVKCDQCAANSNRNESSENCQCLQGFIESAPTQSFCYDRWCASVESNCSGCVERRVVDEDGRCMCPYGQFEEKSICHPCFLRGCLNCSSRSKCQVCDAESRYYLLDNACVYANEFEYLLSQTLQEQLLMQIQLDTEIVFTQISASIYQTGNKNNAQHPLSLNVTSSQMSPNNILIIRASNPNLTLQNVFVSFLLTVQNSTNYSVISSKVQKLIPNELLEEYGSSRAANAASLLVIPFLLTALIVTMSGYKHNQVTFFLQTITFAGYYHDDSKIETTLALHNLRYSFFKFPDAPYFAFFPENYFQSSGGNFKYATIDSNFVRMTETLLIIQVIAIVAFVLFRIANDFLQQIKYSSKGFFEYKKRAFRFLEFLFETCMYPLMFFSINTIINYDCTAYVNKSFRKASFAVSVIVILIHAAATFYLYSKTRLSRMAKFEYLSVFLFSLVTPVAIIFASRTKVLWIVLVILIFLSKDMTYLFFKRKFSEVLPSNLSILFKSLKSLQFVGVASQIVAPILIELNLPFASVVLVFATVTLQLLIQIVVIYQRRRASDFEKIGILSRDQKNKS